MILAALLLALAAPECGKIDLPDIDRAAYATVHTLIAADGSVSSGVFAEPLASTLRERTPPAWLSGVGEMGSVRDLSVYSLNRSGVSDDVMLLRFVNAEGEPLSRRLHLTCRNGRWRVSNVFLHPEGVFLTDLVRTP